MIVTTARSRSVVFGAAGADLIAVLAFAAIGRRSHEEGFSALGVLEVAGPFLFGALVGWLAGRVWRAPPRLPSGVAVWAGTVVVGLATRVAFTHRLPASFVLVASASLAVFVIGWRLVALIAGRVARRTA
ncbi:MAG TPA: DUF3054 domain-containing protein [Pseudonocardia sp.]